MIKCHLQICLRGPSYQKNRMMKSRDHLYTHGVHRNMKQIPIDPLKLSLEADPPFGLMKSRCGPPFGWWNLKADHLWLMNSRGGPLLGGFMLMNSRGGPPFGGLYVDEF